tara:strand:- start:1283 stop:1822 length:540 start_codon:yes stop_codon:yes gene_type:complete
MKDIQEWLIVGIITSPHGIKGQLKIKSLSDFQERFTKPGERWLQKKDEKPVRYKLNVGFKKPGKEIFIISLEGINNRSKAEKFCGYKLLVMKEDIPLLKPNEFHLSELINLKVKIWTNNQLIIIGEVIDLINENNNLIVIKLFESNKEVLIPFVTKIIPTIDFKNKYLIITPPQGLLEL